MHSIHTMTSKTMNSTGRMTSTNMNIELNEAIMEAMILLDPPHLSETSSELSLPSVFEAHDILLTASSIYVNERLADDGMMYLYAVDPCKDELKTFETVSLLADLYRAVILSSTLILEMCPWEDTTTSISSHNSLTLTCLIGAHVKQMHMKISRSILLLQRLGHFCYLSSSRSRSRSRAYSYSYYEYDDWHDDLLPKSHHPLLQECFERKQMMDVEGNVVFGYEDRLVSLRLDDYSYDDTCYTNTYLHEEERFNDGDNDNDIDIGNCSRKRKNSQEEETMDLPISLALSAKELEYEENKLLDIAMHDDRNHDHPYSNSKRNISAMNELESEFIERLKAALLIQYIQIPFCGICSILKQGYLIVRNCSTIISKNDATKDQENDFSMSCRLILFANGTLILYADDEISNERNLDRESHFAFALNGKSKCKATPLDNTFHFSIDNLKRCMEVSVCAENERHCSYSSDSTSLLLGVNEDKGGSLAEGIQWMSAIDTCVNQVATFDEIKDAIKGQWEQSTELD